MEINIIYYLLLTHYDYKIWQSIEQLWQYLDLNNHNT